MKIISNPVKICSGIIFSMCFKVKIFLIFVEFFLEQIFRSLIIYKSSRHAALTIANAKMLLCAESEKSLTRFSLFFLTVPLKSNRQSTIMHRWLRCLRQANRAAAIRVANSALRGSSLAVSPSFLCRAWWLAARAGKVRGSLKARAAHQGNRF